MVNKLKTNVMNHFGPEAKVWFDPAMNQFVGRLESKFGDEQFEARSVSLLTDGYERAVERMIERNVIYLELVVENSNFKESVQAGEARISVDPTESESTLGMKIKMILSIADGAAFRVQQKLFDESTQAEEPDS